MEWNRPEEEREMKETESLCKDLHVFEIYIAIFDIFDVRILYQTR